MPAWIFVTITLLATPAGWDVAGRVRVHGPFPSAPVCEAARDALAAHAAGRPMAVGFCVPKGPEAFAVIRERGLFVARETVPLARETP